MDIFLSVIQICVFLATRVPGYYSWHLIFFKKFVKFWKKKFKFHYFTDILASLGFSLSRLMALFMASKLLGYKGHEKLVDIIATSKVGFPDPIAFAMDLTAFFEDNCKIGK